MDGGTICPIDGKEGDNKSTAPSGFQTPKTNWQPADVVQPSDLNRIEGNINAIEQGARTLNQAQAPSGNAGSLRQILSWLANRIRAITGMTNWYDAPPTTLTAAKSHIDAAAPHSGHETPAGAQAKAEAAAGAVRAELNTHKAERATETKLGHVKAKTTADGALIFPIDIWNDNNVYNVVLTADKDITKKMRESDDYGGAIRALAVDDHYVYVGGETTQTVKKLMKSDLSQVAESKSYGGDILTLAVDDSYVYVGGREPGTVRKLRKSDLSQVAESESYGGDIYGIAVDNSYVYVCGSTTRRVRKLHKSDLSQVAESPGYGGTLRTLAVDGSYVYVGGWTVYKVRKLRKSNLSEVAESESYGGMINALAVDDNYVFVGGGGPQAVWRLGSINIKELTRVVLT